MPRKKAAPLVQTSGAAPKVAAKKIPVDRDALLERFKDYPAIDVITRRFVDPNDPGSLPILLADEAPDACVSSDHQNKLRDNAASCHICKQPARRWYVRWVNTQWEGRWAAIKAKGYVPVEVKELKDEQDVADLVKKAEGSGSVYVRRGDRGHEVLCKMPLELFNYIKRAQREKVSLRSNSKKAMRDDLAEAAGAELGDEAGQMINDGGIMIESMKRVRRSLDEELNDDRIDG